MRYALCIFPPFPYVFYDSEPEPDALLKICIMTVCTKRIMTVLRSYCARVVPVLPFHSPAVWVSEIEEEEKRGKKGKSLRPAIGSQIFSTLSTGSSRT